MVLLTDLLCVYRQCLRMLYLVTWWEVRWVRWLCSQHGLANTRRRWKTIVCCRSSAATCISSERLAIVTLTTPMLAQYWLWPLPACLSAQVGILSKRLNVSCRFLSQMLFSTYPSTMLYRNLGTFKTKGTFLWNFVTAGWQVTPCDLVWHVNSRGEASCRLLYTVTLLYFSQLMDQELMTPVGCFHWAGPFITPSIQPFTFVYNTMGMTQHIVWVRLQQLDATFWRPAVICSISVGLMVWDPC